MGGTRGKVRSRKSALPKVEIKRYVWRGEAQLDAPHIAAQAVDAWLRSYPEQAAGTVVAGINQAILNWLDKNRASVLKAVREAVVEMLSDATLLVPRTRRHG